MGCASSKSTPVVDSIVSGTNDLKESSNGLLKKGKETVKEMADEVCEMGNDISHKIGSMADKLKSSKPNTPETERAQMEGDENDDGEDGEADGSPTVPVRILSIDLDEDNTDELRDNQVPVKVSLSIGDSDNEAGGEKPPTPMPEDDCLNRNGGDRNACTCQDTDDSDSETYFDTMRTRDSRDDEDACCAESVKLNFDDNAAVCDDDCANDGTLRSNSIRSDACATGNRDRYEDCASEGDLDYCATAERGGAEDCKCEDDACAQFECDEDDKCENTGTMYSDESSGCANISTMKTCNECNANDEYSCDLTDDCADDNECANSESEDYRGIMCSQETNTGTLQSECSDRGSDNEGDSRMNGGSTIKCANCATTTNTMYSTGSASSNGFYCDQCRSATIYSQSTDNSAQCYCAGDTGTLQSECSQCGYAYNTMCSGCSYASEESCDADALCADCAKRMGTTKSNFSESTVRSNSFECLNVANDADHSTANTWGKTDTYRSGYSASYQRGSCLVCMGTGTIPSKSAYADTMDSSYSQQYNNCAMRSKRFACTGTRRSQESELESDSKGDAKRTAPCFNICSCLGQNLIQLQLR